MPQYGSGPGLITPAELVAVPLTIQPAVLEQATCGLGFERVPGSSTSSNTSDVPDAS